MLERSAFQIFHGVNSTFINLFDKTKNNTCYKFITNQSEDTTCPFLLVPISWSVHRGYTPWQFLFIIFRILVLSISFHPEIFKNKFKNFCNKFNFNKHQADIQHNLHSCVINIHYPNQKYNERHLCLRPGSSSKHPGLVKKFNCYLFTVKEWSFTRLRLKEKKFVISNLIRPQFCGKSFFSGK